MNHHAVNDEALDTIFRAARTQNAWQDKPVSTALLMAVYDLARMGPTSANCSPARFVFLTTPEAKERLAAHASPGNALKIRTAPVTAIIGYDLDFAQKLPELFPHDQTAKTWFADPAVEQVTAFRNGTLQGAYLLVAARALGLDCGPMSGFDNAKVDAEFFAGTRIKSNFICGLGHGDPSGVFERNPRLSFDEACRRLWKLLAADTALGACSVVILDGETILAHRFEPMERGHAEALAPMVEAAMADAGLAFAALDRLAVTTGPGTFTGQRVGLAFLRGLRVALGKPLVGVTTLAAMQAQAKAETGLEAAALHDARRGEVYLQFDGEPLVMPFEEAVAALAGRRIALAGTAAPAAAARLADAILSSVRQPDALWVARLARLLPDPDAPPAPLYLRAPDAKLPGTA